jgi:hypothetical protein
MICAGFAIHPEGIWIDVTHVVLGDVGHGRRGETGCGGADDGMLRGS